MAERQGRKYVPVTESGAEIHAARQARAAFREMHERLKEVMEKDAGQDGQEAVHMLDCHNDPKLGGDTRHEERKPSVNERLKDVLNKPRKKLEIGDEPQQ